MEKLRELHNARSEGLISDAEFENAKRAALMSVTTVLPVEPELLPRQTFEAVKYIMSTWGFSPEAPLADLLHMYRATEGLTEIARRRPYFGVGYDPERHKSNGGATAEWS